MRLATLFAESNFCRPNQAENLKEFLIEDNPDLLPPSDPNDIDPNDTTKMPASKMRDHVKMTSFGQQNKLISNAQQVNRPTTLTKKELAFYDPKGLRVLSLFGGIECTLVAIKQLSMKIEKYVSCDIDETARKLVMNNHIDLYSQKKLIFIDDINNINAAYVERHGPFHLVIGGSPCQDFR